MLKIVDIKCSRNQLEISYQLFDVVVYVISIEGGNYYPRYNDSTKILEVHCEFKSWVT
jgi:hypothetical protein